MSGTCLFGLRTHISSRREAGPPTAEQPPRGDASFKSPNVRSTCVPQPGREEAPPRPPSVRETGAAAGLAPLCARSAASHVGAPLGAVLPGRTFPRSCLPAPTPHWRVVRAPVAPPETRPISASALLFPSARPCSPGHRSFINRLHLSPGSRVCFRSTPAGLAEADGGREPASVRQHRKGTP